MRTRIKICCIQNIAEAQTVIEAGADAIGLVAKMPSGPGPIKDEIISEITQAIPPLIGTFLLTSETSPSEIVKHHAKTLTNTIQLVDLLAEGTYKEVRDALPAIKLVQVIHILDERSIDLAVNLSSHVDALLLDSGNPNLQIKELGGTGRVHNWKLSREIRDNAKCPVILAGGLHSGNIRKAIEDVQPFAVDVCSGVRTDGSLDKNKLSAFIQNIINAV